MTTMIERVARAICEAEWGENSWLLVSNHSRSKAEIFARVAVESLREPTDGMAAAASDAADWDGGDPIWAYKTMIDAALKEHA